jgi:5-(carboxyamino)imidazole ribonucleotide mutase
VGIIMGSTSDWETMERTANTLRELGVPYETRVVSAHRTPDLLFEYASTAEMPGGIPVGTLAIGKAGAINAALLAAAILGNKHPAIRESLRAFRIAQTRKVLAQPDPAAAARSALKAVHAQLSGKKKK